jgi:hypothetical protein
VVEFLRADDGVELALDDVETSIIRGLCNELRELISDQDAANDPVVGRLFPAAYDDPTEQASYESLVGDDLSKHKLQALEVVSSALDSPRATVVLNSDTLDAWLACLTDMRLAIGTRLEVDEERMAADIDPADPNARPFAVLHWLGGIQEGILRAVSSGLES